MLDHISHSQIQMFLKCGEQYRQRYIDGKIVPPSAALVRGKCGHHANEINFSQKIETRTDLPIDDVKDAFSDAWEREKYAIAWTEKDLNGDSPSVASGKVKDQGIALVEIFQKEQAPLIQPVAVEQTFDVHFDGPFPKLTGIMDRIDEDEAIAEVKFVSKAPPADDIITDIQLTIYELGYRAQHGRPPKKLRKQWAVSTKVPKTVCQEVDHRDDDTITRLMWRLQVALEALEKGVFIPAPHGAWWCSSIWCGYWTSCKYHP